MASSYLQKGQQDLTEPQEINVDINSMEWAAEIDLFSYRYMLTNQINERLSCLLCVTDGVTYHKIGIRS